MFLQNRMRLSGLFLFMVIFGMCVKWLICRRTVWEHGTQGELIWPFRCCDEHGWSHCPWPFPAAHSLSHNPPPTHLLPSVPLGINAPLIHYSSARLEWKRARPDVSAAQESLPSSIVTALLRKTKRNMHDAIHYFPFISPPSLPLPAHLFFSSLSACLFVCGRFWPRWFTLFTIIYLIAKVPSCLLTCKDCRDENHFYRFFFLVAALQGSIHQSRKHAL